MDFTLNPALRPRIKMNAAFLRIDVNLGDVVVGERLDDDGPQIPGHHLRVWFYVARFDDCFAHRDPWTSTSVTDTLTPE